MTFNVISAIRNLTSISGVHQNGKSYFARPARAIMSKRYFRYLGYLWVEVTMVLLMVVQVVVEVARPLPAPGVDSTLFHKS